MNHRALILNLRWLSILLAFGLVQLDTPLNLANGVLVGALALYGLSNMALTQLPERLFVQRHPVWLVLVAFDIAIISVLIYQMGSVRGDSFFLFLPVIAMAACHLGQTGTFITVSGATVAYSTLLYLMLPEGVFVEQIQNEEGFVFRILLLIAIGAAFGYLAQRLRDQTVGKDVLNAQREDLEAVVAASHEFAATLKQSEIFNLLVQKAARLVGAFRCSVVYIDEDGQSGSLLISREILDSAQEGVHTPRLKIDMDNYPEIRAALQSGQPVMIPEVRKETLLSPVADKLAQVGLRSLLVVPITINDPAIGTLMLCLGRRRGEFTARDVGLCELLANVGGNVLKNAYVYESMAEENLSLQKLAISDPLTGLYNRRFFDMRLSEEFRLATRHNLPLSLVLMDVDHFKRINDTHGHQAGDEVLTALARVIQDNTRHSDCLARYGGEEFIMLLPLTDREGAMAKAEEIRLAVKEMVHELDGTSARLSISCGVADFNPAVCKDQEMLVALADHAVYMAKQGGRDQVRYCGDLSQVKPPQKSPASKRTTK